MPSEGTVVRVFPAHVTMLRRSVIERGERIVVEPARRVQVLVALKVPDRRPRTRPEAPVDAAGGVAQILERLLGMSDVSRGHAGAALADVMREGGQREAADRQDVGDGAFDGWPYSYYGARSARSVLDVRSAATKSLAIAHRPSRAS